MWLGIYQCDVFWFVGPNAPPPKVRGHNTSSTSIWVDWDIVPAADQNGIILTYTVMYKALPDKTPQSIVLIAAITQANLTGLMKYRNYSITVFASTSNFFFFIDLLVGFSMNCSLLHRTRLSSSFCPGI